MSSTLTLKFNEAKLRLDLTNFLNQSNYIPTYLGYYNLENTIIEKEAKKAKAKLKTRAYVSIKA